MGVVIICGAAILLGCAACPVAVAAYIGKAIKRAEKEKHLV